MFNIDTRPTFTRLVKVKVPAGTGFEEQSFTASFKALDIEETKAFDFTTGAGTTEFLRDVILSFGDVVSDAGPVEYSAELRDQVIAKQWARVPLLQAYWEGLNGEAEGN
jgi:hypothetical protein